MASEVELKLALAPEDEGALRAAAALSGIPASAKRMVAIYFDTPRHDLAHARMALRLRREGRRWIQTLKAGGKSTGGMHERSEWEFTRTRPSIDLSLFADTPLADVEDAATLHERLVEVFRIDSTRTTWEIAPWPGTRVEVALDRGRVAAKGRAEDFCEVEIERKEGEPGAAFDVASRLLEEVALRPSAVTKAERGYRLALRRRLAPVKAAQIALDAKLTVAGAARLVIGAALDQLQANGEGVLATTNPEFVHQARVALRRMRSAMKTFGPAIGAQRAQAWRRALGELGTVLGTARDWDVLGTETLPRALAAYGDPKVRRTVLAAVTRRRRGERESARAAIRSRASAAVILELARWLPLEEEAPGADAAAGSLLDFAVKRIRKRHKLLLADAANLEKLTLAERHQVRIDTKRLRYKVDALASLFPEKRLERYLEVLGGLQDALGHANDATTAGRLLAELDPPEPFAAFARGWFAAQAAGDPMVFGLLRDNLADAPRFWRHAAQG